MAGEQTLPAVLRAAAERFRDRPAFVEGQRTPTFADLLAEVRATARGYLAHGLEPGDRVCLWAPNSLDWVVAALAVSYAGGTLVPINSRSTGHEAADIVDHTKAKIVVVADGFLGRTQIADLRGASALPSVRQVVEIADLDAVNAAGRDVPAADVEARADAVAVTGASSP